MTTNTFKTAWENAHTAYMHLIKLGRILFKNDYAVFIKLALNKERKKSFSGWLTQVRKFYTSLLADPAALAQYALYNTPLTAINTAKALVDTAEQANVLQTKETGEAQKATQDRDTQLDALDSVMSEFYALAHLAGEDAPQLLEMIEIVVEGGKQSPAALPRILTNRASQNRISMSGKLVFCGPSILFPCALVAPAHPAAQKRFPLSGTSHIVRKVKHEFNNCGESPFYSLC